MAEPCTSWAANRRHYSNNLVNGRGTAVCPSRPEVWTQAAAVESGIPHLRLVRVADLPMCRRCAGALGRS